jgi:hypothetical protein
MDAIVGLLDGPRARGAFLLRALMDPPWSVRVQDEAPLSLLAMVRGDAWVVPDRRGKTTHLGPGDVAITRADAPAWYRAHDDPVVGRALRMIHNNPDHPWTVAALAAEIGVSRAALAK